MRVNQIKLERYDDYNIIYIIYERQRDDYICVVIWSLQ